MPNYPNLVPQNDLRLPDALTIKHGPKRLLSSFVLEGDKAVAGLGIRLRLRHDFDALHQLNKREVDKGEWFKLVEMFNPELGEISPENAFWISGENDAGEIVTTLAGRVYHWPSTTLADEVRLMFYGGRDIGQRCVVTAATAPLVSGVIYYGGALWVRPDFRGRKLSRLMPRLGRAYAAARWPLDWALTFVAPGLVAKGVAAGYGYTDVSFSILFPASPWGDLEVALVRMPGTQIYDDLAAFLRDELVSPRTGFTVPAEPFSSVAAIEQRVTSTSFDVVRQGSNSLS